MEPTPELKDILERFTKTLGTRTARIYGSVSVRAVDLQVLVDAVKAIKSP